MRLSIKGMAITLALLWGGCLLTVGLINVFDPAYGTGFLAVMSSVYPGFHASHSLANAIVGAIEATMDGAIAGALVAWLYNKLSPRIMQPAEHAKAGA